MDHGSVRGGGEVCPPSQWSRNVDFGLVNTENTEILLTNKV